jgi:hypothetical protein
MVCVPWVAAPAELVGLVLKPNRNRPALSGLAASSRTNDSYTSFGSGGSERRPTTNTPHSDRAIWRPARDGTATTVRIPPWCLVRSGSADWGAVCGSHNCTVESRAGGGEQGEPVGERHRHHRLNLDLS